MFRGRSVCRTVSAPKRREHFSMRTATMAGTCLDAVASALSASAGLEAGVALAALSGAQSKLGPTQTARLEADIMFWDELAEMCQSTHRKWRRSVTLALGNRSHNLQGVGGQVRGKDKEKEEAQ